MEVLAALFALLPFGGIVGVVMLLVWVGNKQNQQRQAVWAETARRMQLEYRYDRIAGVRHGQAVQAALVQRGSGKSRHTFTVVSSELRTPYDVGLTVRSHGFFEDLFFIHEHFRSDMIWMVAHLGCKNTQALLGMMREKCRQRSIPLLTIEYDLGDSRVVSKDGIKEQVTMFMKTVMGA